MPLCSRTGRLSIFETTALRKDGHLTLRRVNANVPVIIAVRWVKTAPDDFHARFSYGPDAISSTIIDCVLRC